MATLFSAELDDVFLRAKEFESLERRADHIESVRRNEARSMELNTTNSRRKHQMDLMTANEGFVLELFIEELEPKIAPDGGETVLPLGPVSAPPKP